MPDSRRPSSLRAADRLQGINPFRVMTVLERANALEREGRSIIHLEVGEPDFVTAAPVVEAGRAALASGHTAYTPAAGLPQLREAIAGHYRRRHGLEIPADRIFVTPGASGALSLLAQMLLNPGDAVLMTDPGYPCNRNYVRLAGAEAILVPVTARDNYQLSPALLTRHATAQCRSVWLATPSNPTGTVLDLSALQGIHAWCQTQGCHLLVDEIYHGLDYVGGLPSALQLGDVFYYYLADPYTEMTKGTFSFGRRHQHVHTLCVRCGRKSYHIQSQACSSCGFPAAKMRKYQWAEKTLRRRTQGTGRMKYLKDVPRRAKNGFREGTKAPARKVSNKSK